MNRQQRPVLVALLLLLVENRDGRRMLLQDGALPLDEMKEIREEVGKAAKGASLSPTELLRIGKTARVGERVRRFFEDRRGRYPRLAHHANGIPPLRDLADPGFTFMNGPGNDLEGIAGQVGAGCNLILFVTGNGSITNFPFVPTLKITTTTGNKLREMVQQVLVEVRLAEISRNVGERIGVNFNFFNRTGNDFGVSQINNLASITNFIRGFNNTTFLNSLSPNITAIAGFKTGSVLWTMFFDILKRNNLGRILAEPNLVTTSGQEASFLAGGEFPIPVPQASGGGTVITIEIPATPAAVTTLPAPPS